jgi:large subunit ribosomal protein L23
MTNLIFKKPHLSEKATRLKDSQSAYVFVVDGSANKKTVASEIKRLYKVEVVNVRIVNLPKKPKNLGRTKGFAPGFKKAIVYLKPGQAINVI